MKTIHTVILLLFAATAFSQSYSPFYVGSWAFGPEFDYPPRILYSVRGFDNSTPPPPDSVRYHRLTPVQLDRARELGLNLIGVTVQTSRGPFTNTLVQTIPPGSDTHHTLNDRGFNGDFVRRDRNPLNANAVAEICDAAISAADTLMVSISDYALEDYLRGEHLMFHPETDDNFEAQGSHWLGTEPDFDDSPMTNMNLSRPLTDRSVGGPNCIRMEANKGTISTLADEKKRELSLFRAGWNMDDRDKYRGSGLYILSVIVREDNDPFALDPPNTSDIVMNVEIVSRDPVNPSTQRTLTFPLRGEQFYHGSSAIRPGAFEVVLGQIEIRGPAAASFPICALSAVPSRDGIRGPGRPLCWDRPSSIRWPAIKPAGCTHTRRPGTVNCPKYRVQ